ncbi:MAG TPA: hypothetical protein VIL64_06350 [Solirubrobacteraceae bacterium]|jgi:hypothetical protein
MRFAVALALAIGLGLGLPAMAGAAAPDFTLFLGSANAGGDAISVQAAGVVTTTSIVVDFYDGNRAATCDAKDVGANNPVTATLTVPAAVKLDTGVQAAQTIPLRADVVTNHGNIDADPYPLMNFGWKLTLPEAKTYPASVTVTAKSTKTGRTCSTTKALTLAGTQGGPALKLVGAFFAGRNVGLMVLLHLPGAPAKLSAWDDVLDGTVSTKSVGPNEQESLLTFHGFKGAQGVAGYLKGSDLLECFLLYDPLPRRATSAKYRIRFDYMTDQKGFPARTIGGTVHIARRATGDLRRCRSDAATAAPSADAG